MKFYVRGDCHGDFDWLERHFSVNELSDTAVIILGDAGFNFHLDKRDRELKKFVEKYECYIYCVRGKHEARPQHLDSVEYIFDKTVDGWVMYEPEFPHIRYFLDYGIYDIDGYKCLVIGGAYSVDKWWRLRSAGVRDKLDKNYFNAKRTGWFSDEQLTEAEMRNCERIIAEPDDKFDFVFTHTCPLSYQPTDLFLGSVDQSTVDSTMEKWLEEIAHKITVKYAWCFGHYHADRLERPHVEQYFDDIEKLDSIKERWVRYDETEELDWYLVKSPFFYFDFPKNS